MKPKYPNVSSPVIINKDLTRFEDIFKGDEFYENLEVVGHTLANGSYDPSRLPYLGHLLGAKIEWKFAKMAMLNRGFF